MKKINFQQFIELFWIVVIAAVLAYAMYSKDVNTIDKILLVALGLFKGADSIKKISE